MNPTEYDSTCSVAWGSHQVSEGLQREHGTCQEHVVAFLRLDAASEGFLSYKPHRAFYTLIVMQKSTISMSKFHFCPKLQAPKSGQTGTPPKKPQHPRP